MKSYKIILQPSDIMERNQRETESNFIRMRQSLRKKFNLECDDKVALFARGASSSLPKIILTVRQAYREDIIHNPTEEVCFVTTRNYNFYGGSSDFLVQPYDMMDFITMGADPEFVLIDPTTDYVVAANRFKKDKEFDLNTAFGFDGAGTPAELRPAPSSDISELCNNILKALKTGERLPEVKKLKWKPGAFCEGLALGGHIHIGYAPQIGEHIREKSGLPILVQILDHYLGSLLVNIDGKDANQRKRIHDYGQAGNYREDSGRFEWRVPSGMWLCDKRYSEGLLGLSKLLAVKYYKEIQALPSITQNKMTSIRKNVFDISDEDLGQNREKINGHTKLSNREIEVRLNKLSDLLQEDYFLGQLESIIKLPLSELHQKEDEDLRAIWY